MANSDFGSAVALDGNALVVGSPNFTSPGDNFSGAVTYFEYDPGSQSWIEKFQITASDVNEELAVADSRFGASVALSNGLLVVGAPGALTGGISTGAAFTFSISNGQPVIRGAYYPQDLTENDQFGASVATNGTQILVGALDSDKAGRNSGEVFAFEFIQDEVILTSRFTASDAVEGDSFGWDIAMDGTRALIGARDVDAGLIANVGAGYIYEYDATSAIWTEIARLDVPVPQGEESVGESVALKGNVAVLGARDFVPGGAAFVYELNTSSNAWSHSTILQANDIQENDLLGHDVAISEDRIAVSSRLKNQATGATYIFQKNNGVWAQTSRLVVSDLEPNLSYGSSIALSSSFLAVGAPGGDGNVDQSGTAYVYGPFGTTSPDRSALAALYASTDGDQWTNNTNWLSNAPLGDWHGVTTGSDGRVTKLTLIDNNLSGSLPSQLGDLSNLEDINLASNNLTGPIPPQLSQLEQLVNLRLHINTLNGLLPADLGNLTNLKTLYLSGNDFTGSIPEKWGDLSDLQILLLNTNNLSGPVPTAIGNLKDLTTLRIAGNNFTELPNFANGEYALPLLEELDVRSNMLTFEDLEPNVSIENFQYAPQAEFGTVQDQDIFEGESFQISHQMGGTNSFQWTRNGSVITTALTSSISKTAATLSDDGSYVLRVVNASFPDLTLSSVPSIINVTPIENFSANLSSYNLLPSKSNSASGSISATLAGNTLTVSGSYTGLPLPFSSAQIFIGGINENGGGIFELVASASSSTSGTFNETQNSFDLTEAQIGQLADGLFYVLIRSQDGADTTPSELRGHLYTESNTPPSASNLVLPANGANINLSSNGALGITWSATTDPEGSETFNVWQFSRQSNFSELDYVLRVETGTSLTVPYTTLDGILASKGVAQGESIAIYHQLLSSDGSLITTGESRQLTLQRGVANVPPVVVSPLEDQIRLLGTEPLSIDLNTVFEDPENGALTFAASSSLVNVATVSITDNILSISGVAAGATTITVTARDPQNARVQDAFKLTINETPNILSEIADVTLVENGPSFQTPSSLYFSDADPLTYLAFSSRPAIASAVLDTDSDTLIVTPINPGSTTITLRAIDDKSGSAELQFVVSVQEQGTGNLSPVVSNPLPNRTLLLSDGPIEVVLDSIFADPEGGILTFEANSDDQNIAQASILEPDTLIVAPISVGRTTILAVALDPEGARTTEAFTLVVNERPLLVSTIEDQALLENGNNFIVDLNTIFTDADPLSFRAVSSNNQVATAALSGGTTLLVVPGETGVSLITVTASDNKGASTETTFSVNVQADVVYPVLVSESIDITFADPNDETSYRLVALPGDVSLPLARAIPGTPDVDWIAYRDLGTDGNKEVYLQKYAASDSFLFAPGRGFWLISRQPWSRSENQTTVTLSAQGTYMIPLQAGWNIISNPFESGILWADVQTINEISQDLYQWTGAFSVSETFASASTGQAYYFFNEEGLDELALPYFPLANSRVSPKTEGITLHVTIEDQPSSHVHASWYVEKRPESEHTTVQVAPPGNFEQASLRLLRESAPKPGSRKNLLIKQTRPASLEGYSYQLQLDAKAGGPVDLLPESLEEVPVGMRAVLIENETGRLHELEEETPIRFWPDENTMSMTLLVGSNAFIEEASHSVLPEELALLPSYPNPFNNQTQISFTLPLAESVTLSIYDVLGRERAVLIDDDLEAGFHEFSWEGRDQMGSELPSGVYLYRLRVGNSIHTRTMTRVR